MSKATNVPYHVPIHTQTPYTVTIGRNLLSGCAEAIRTVAPPCTVMLVCDDHVETLYASRVRTSLIQAGYRVETFVFPHGEQSKSTETLVTLLETLAQAHITRTDLIVALGGGVTGDLAGLAAAIYLRGIRFVQLPTTLLAAVDSSVGGKTAVNLKMGKNLCGAFHQPSLVLCDCDTFETLPDDIFRDGLAESIKYGVLRDEALFACFERFRRGDDIAPLVRACVQMKDDYVRGDEQDHGKRQFLNLGHTAAHAIEALSGLRISHGHAVAIGMVIIARASERMGMAQAPMTARLQALLTAQGLPVDCTFDAQSLAQAALSDKKRSADTLTLVVPVKIGACVLHQIPVCELADWFKAGIAQ